MAAIQTAIVIALVLIGIIVTLFLIAQVSIRAGEFAPFLDGTKIRIRSLINNKYICVGSGVRDELFFGCNRDQISSIWVLCQNQQVESKGQYAIFPQGSPNRPILFVRSSKITGVTLTLDPKTKSCAEIKGDTPPATSSPARSNVFVNFILVETGSGSSTFDGKVSNVYRIVTSDDASVMYADFESDIGAGSFVSAISVPLRPQLDDDLLRSSFVVEVVSQ